MTVVVNDGYRMRCCRKAGNNTRAAGDGRQQHAENSEKGQQLFERHGIIMRCYDLVGQYPLP